MIPRSVIAHEFRISLQAGLVDRAEIIRWADEMMISEPYDEVMADLCMAAGATATDLDSMLSLIPATEKDKWDGTRRMLGRMHEALRREPDRLSEFTRILTSILIENSWKVPDDFQFISDLVHELDMDYYFRELAGENNRDNTEDRRAMLLENLSRFKLPAEQSSAIHSTGP